jgi:hypothetical protein
VVRQIDLYLGQRFVAHGQDGVYFPGGR